MCYSIFQIEILVIFQKCPLCRESNFAKTKRVRILEPSPEMFALKVQNLEIDFSLMKKENKIKRVVIVAGARHIDHNYSWL